MTLIEQQPYPTIKKARLEAAIIESESAIAYDEYHSEKANF